MVTLKLVPLTGLKTHEAITAAKLERVITSIQKSRRQRRPIIVDRKSHVILDGHHRYTALKSLGARRVAALLVNYADEQIVLQQRRKNIPVSKEAVLTMAREGRVFPAKTTRHLIPGARININLPLHHLY